MRTIIRLLILLALAHALFRVGQATVGYYTLRDEAELIARHEAGKRDDVLQQRVVEAARSAGIEVGPEQVLIMRDGDKTVIDVRYEKPIELLPRWFQPWQFHFAVEAAASRPLTPRDVLP